MITARVAVLEMAARLSQRLRPHGRAPGEPWLVTTPVGIKYVGRGFDSALFDRHVTRTIEPIPGAWSWDDMLLSPDLLRDEHTQCGQPITRSPHIRFMREIIEERVEPGSEYVRRCASGTLDARRGASLDVDSFKRVFRARAEEMTVSRRVDIRVFPPREFDGRVAYVIADGKHRAAQAALMGFPRVRLHVIADTIFAHPFFRKLYDAVLVAPDAYYSVNQHMVRMLRHE